MSNFLTKLIGSRNQRVVKRMRKSVDAINAREADLEGLSDEQLTAKTDEFRERLAQGESLDDLLGEAFAVVREGAKRVLGMRHFDVQLVGGQVLHQGKIAEMKTGEGKTLVATLTTYLNALEQKGVHIITVNDYLAARDADWMGRLYRFLGLTVGVIFSGQDTEAKRAAYACDITYGTNNEFGFDYLRDNMAFTPEDRVQRKLNYCIIDEVDSILIDEARTPLIISGPTDDDPETSQRVDKLVKHLTEQEEEDGPGDYSKEEKNKQVHLTEEGHQKVEALMREAGLLAEDESLYDANNVALMHHMNAALRAHALYTKNIEYIIADGEVVIVDEFTGRTMPGRRWSDGLHQAIEAKEGVPIQKENQTLASITFQNFFRLYDKLAGMTGTADTEAFEFQSIYDLEVVVIPTNRPLQRKDLPDQIYMTGREKFEAIADEAVSASQTGQPVLIGTASIDASEVLSQLLKQRGIRHEVLNAKQHEREAEIIAQAGRPGAVTIATNMAGRGTDIVLGGNIEEALEALEADDEASRQRLRDEWQKTHEAVLEAGGLYVIGSERHESRRVDNQLRGRSGRQGDPGASRFYLSLEDSLMRIFTPPRLRSMLQNLGLEDGEAIEHKWVTRAIENAQQKVERHHFDIRKQLLEYDNVANDQRQVVYEQRNEIMDAEDISDLVENIWVDVVDEAISEYIPPASLEEQWDVEGLEQAIERDFGAELPIQKWLDDEDHLDEEGLRERISEHLKSAYEEKRQAAGAENMAQIEKAVVLQVLDSLWREHLAAMDYLRKGIHLRGYAQKDPKNEYKREAFEMFNNMLSRLKHEAVTVLARGRIDSQITEEAREDRRRQMADLQFQHEDAASAAEQAVAQAQAEADAAAQPEIAPEAAAQANLPGAGQPAGSGPAVGEDEELRPDTFVRDGRKIGRNEPCPCGSGKKYKHCHGRDA
ncbi:preprotein translocase subunit SecA [Salinisphaera hydrothermalis]|uniref:Protein translocase subunit SecA n=1 Tax=Salinisphaera hydrothermalis (strain C41B8) TaxID=1304275 RepID=A0A084IP43_SALHC|nr:preprotein translocase subunit SecA [Salinisphaera hydrothermalis]KEZ78477.1 preprotein translocase subunit SecA [Salinisphaera hydrothermalis C41B8]